MPDILWISTGASRRETSWKNIQLTWAQLSERLKAAKVCPETVKEYIFVFDKETQDIKKDVGAYLGGTITGGRRVKKAITSRSVLTLDIDFAGPDFWDNFQTFFGQACVIHGSRKHLTPDKKTKEIQYRYRLIMPLAREVQPDEYEAVGRKVAGILDIELFDKTSFQPERLMYWPSVCSDQKYYCVQQSGPWLDPDKILGMYKNWKDQSQWPYHAEVIKEVQENVKKQQDPREKSGLVGAFCQVYGITEVIAKYLDDVYEETDHPDRYTFKTGSTSGGLIIYDDLFAYSWHGTDPGSLKLMNAWDLVRIHKFKDLDKDSAPRTNTTKLPSQKAMYTLAGQDAIVTAHVMDEKMGRAKEWFIEEVDAEEIQDNSWMTDMDMNPKTKDLLTTYKNITLILENDIRIKGKIRFNELTKVMEVVRPLVWDKPVGQPGAESYPRSWSDDDMNQLRKLLGIAPYELQRTPKLEDCMAGVRAKNRYHPIKDYLESLIWDGQDRVDFVLIDYLRAEETDYVKAVTRKTLVAAVARIMQPGIKFDHVLTFVGDEGIGKSSVISRLGRDWHSDTFSFHMLDKGNKAYEQIRGKWLVEIGEMSGLKRAEIEATKSFLSSVEDSYRPSYGHEVVNFKRQNIFFGGSNKPEFLRRFGGGNRRFWVVDCHAKKEDRAFDELSPERVDQIWAEAVELWKGGETLYLDMEMENQAFEVQQAHEESNDQVGIVAQFLDELLPEDWAEKTSAERSAYFKYRDEMSKVGTVKRDKICVPEIWIECMGKTRGDMTTQNTKIYHDIMKEMPGWIRSKWKMRFKEYGMLTGYVRIGSDVAAVVEKEF